ncbi:MAG: glycosyltransferase family 4 protein [Alistipes sp.]|nr:glycosyltransferase family 4 protein [Alistipes sp.]
MKIAFIGGRDIHLLGGIENYMFNLATTLVEQGHEPIVYCESDHNGQEWGNGFKVVYRRSFGGRFLCKILLSFSSTMHALCKESGVEYFHYNAWPPSLWSWIPRLCGRKALLMGHGLEWKRTKYSPFQQKIMHLMERLTAAMHRNIAVVSEEQRAYFAEAYSRCCVTIPTAVNMPDGRAEDSDILQRYGLEKEYYLLYLGRLVQDKNPDYLIRAFKEAATEGYKLVIAGSNDQLPDYVAHLHSLAEGRSDIIFTGAVYGADKETLLRHATAFCIPSTIEGLAITLLEAMSYGRLCIASNIPSNKEGLGDSGVWVEAENVEDLAEKITYTLDNLEVLAPQKEAVRKRVEENFTWNRITDLYVDYLKSI